MGHKGRISRKRKKEKMSAEQRRKVLRITLIAAVSVFLLVAMLLSPLFAIRKVTVSPMVSYTEDDMAPYLAEIMGRNGFLAVADHTTFSQSQHIFSMEMPGIAERILFELPYLESVRVRYVFPNRVQIDVTERTAAFLLEYYGIYLLIDTHGVVMDTFTREDCPEMPLVQGIHIDDYKIGVSITEKQDSRIDMAIQLCDMMRQLSMESYIDIIDVTDYNDIQLYCAPSLTILFGAGKNLGVKLTELKGILDTNLTGESNGVLDMRSGGHTTFVENAESKDPETDDLDEQQDDIKGEEES